VNARLCEGAEVQAVALEGCWALLSCWWRPEVLQHLEHVGMSRLGTITRQELAKLAACLHMLKVTQVLTLVLVLCLQVRQKAQEIQRQRSQQQQQQQAAAAAVTGGQGAAAGAVAGEQQQQSAGGTSGTAPPAAAAAPAAPAPASFMEEGDFIIDDL
jgi:hypothetical protein